MFLKIVVLFFLSTKFSYASNSMPAQFIDGEIKDGNIYLSGSKNLSGMNIAVSSFVTNGNKLIECKIERGRLDYEGKIYEAGYHFKDGVWFYEEPYLNSSKSKEEIELEKQYG